MAETAPHMAAGISILQPPDQELVQNRTGNHSQLAKF
jgi:hypothetical protein